MRKVDVNYCCLKARKDPSLMMMKHVQRPELAKEGINVERM